MKVQIGIENYEEYLIDYLEGNLNAALEQELMLFLKEHPQVAEEFELLQQQQQMPYAEKLPALDFSALKQPEQLPVEDLQLIAFLEGDLDRQEEMEVRQKIAAYPEWKQANALYQQTFLQKESITFPDKASLKRSKTAVISLWVRYGAVAATILVIGIGAGLHLLIKQKKNTVAEQLPTNTAPAIVGSKRPLIAAATLQTNHSKKGSKSNHKKHLEVVTPAKENVKEMNLVAPKMLQRLTVADVQMTAIPSLKLQVSIQPSPQAEPIVMPDVKYQTAGKWLFERVKDIAPEPTILLADTIGKVIAAKPPLKQTFKQILAKATGIKIEEKNPLTDNARGFAIVSRYFSLERIEHP